MVLEKKSSKIIINKQWATFNFHEFQAENLAMNLNDDHLKYELVYEGYPQSCIELNNQLIFFSHEFTNCLCALTHNILTQNS